MSRRKNLERPDEPSVQKLSPRVPRRRRRKPYNAKPQPPPAQGKPAPLDSAPDDYVSRTGDAGPLKMSRAPRTAEPPPPDPNVFSYTFTIWKSS